MCTNGSSSWGSAPANARCTGKPSPSRPAGAVVTLATGRSRVAVASGQGLCGRAVMSSTVTAGMSGAPRTLATSQRQRFDRRHHGGAILPVDAGDIDVQLDLIAVGVFDVQTVGHRVITHAGDLCAGLAHALEGVAQLVVGVAHLETEVIQ